MATGAQSRATRRHFVLGSFGSPEVLRLVKDEIPAPGRDEILIEVEAAGVNFADTMIRRGEYLRDQPLSLSPGSEVVGRVIETGGATDHSLGDRVAAWIETGGGYATHVLASPSRAYKVPDDIPAAAVAAVFLQGTTAAYAIERFGRVRPGDRVLVHAAAGGVGGIAVQLAKLAGATVVGVASSSNKRQVVLDHGADLAIAADPDELRAAAGPRGFDVVVDGVGGPIFEPSIEQLAFNGRYVVVGSASQQPASLDARRLLPRGQTLSGFILLRVMEADPSEPAATMARLCGLVKAGVLRPLYRTVPLESVPDVHRWIEDRTVAGKIVLEVADV
jgi:NADPH2:quinone reductase